MYAFVKSSRALESPFKSFQDALPALWPPLVNSRFCTFAAHTKANCCHRLFSGDRKWTHRHFGDLSKTVRCRIKFQRRFRKSNKAVKSSSCLVYSTTGVQVGVLTSKLSGRMAFELPNKDVLTASQAGGTTNGTAILGEFAVVPLLFFF